MTGSLSEVYLYRSSDVDNRLANYIIDVIYREKQIFILNSEQSSKNLKKN